METVTDTAILEKLIQSEAGQAAKAAIERDHTAMRMNLKAQAETLRRERGEQGRELADGVQVTQKRLEQARKVLSEAEQEHRLAVMQQKQQAASYDSRIKALENKLWVTAPMVIDSFIEWLGDQESDCKGTAILENAQRTDKINTHNYECVKQYFSNAESLRARLAAIRAARAEAESLKPLILDAGDIEQRLQELRDSLPAVTMQFSHER